MVSFRRRDVWPDSASEDDLITLEVYHNWLERVASHPSEGSSHEDHEHVDGSDTKVGDRYLSPDQDPGHAHSVPHSHASESSVPLDGHEHGGGDHSHGHVHEERERVETNAVDREGPSTPGQQIGEALLRLLVRKGVTDMSTINRTIETLDMAGKSLRGAELVARAWLDPAFKARLLADGRANQFATAK